MTENQPKSEIAPQRRSLKLAPALGDWTTYKPARAGVKKIKSGLYGFDRLSEEELKTAHTIHYNFAEAFLNNLSKHIDANLEIFNIDALQSSYSAFVRGQTFQLVQGQIEVPGQSEKIFFSADLPLAEAILNSALGCKNAPPLKRELTEAENLTLETSINKDIAEYNKAFNSIFQSAACQITGSPYLSADASVGEQSSYVYFKIKISIGGTHGSLVIGYTAKLIKGLLAQYQAKAPRRSLSLNKLPKEVLNSVKLSLKADLGTSMLTTLDLANLEVGDVIAMDNSIHNAIKIIMEDGKVLLGQPAVSGKKYAVKVVRIEKEKEVRVAPPEITREEEISPEEMLEEKVEEAIPEGEEEAFKEEEFPEAESHGEGTIEEEAEEEFPEEEEGIEEEAEEEEEFPEEEGFGEEDKF